LEIKNKCEEKYACGGMSDIKLHMLVHFL